MFHRTKVIDTSHITFKRFRSSNIAQYGASNKLFTSSCTMHEENLGQEGENKLKAEETRGK